jgi:hypothetical protein
MQTDEETATLYLPKAHGMQTEELEAPTRNGLATNVPG